MQKRCSPQKSPYLYGLLTALCSRKKRICHRQICESRAEGAVQKQRDVSEENISDSATDQILEHAPSIFLLLRHGYCVLNIIISTREIVIFQYNI